MFFLLTLVPISRNRLFSWSAKLISTSSAPEINISSVPDIVSGSRHFLKVTWNSCWSSVYDTLLKFENLLVIVTGRKRIPSVTHEIVPDCDRWPAVISCTDRRLKEVCFHYLFVFQLSWVVREGQLVVVVVCFDAIKSLRACLSA